MEKKRKRKKHLHIDVKAKNEDGSVVFEGLLNRNEVGFLLMYAIKDLLDAGVQFNLQNDEGDEEDPDVRMKFPMND
jgi:hypothetical protein